MVFKNGVNFKNGFLGNLTDGFLKPYFYLSPQLGENPAEFIKELISGDSRFFFGVTELVGKNYNYNENTVLIQAKKEATAVYFGIFFAR
ncbi:MAG: hypothetical protein N3A64_05580 [Desulfobacterota bacterium]|nr:hypothetical protein [Thermodesulfobacteriota bacterium]